MAITMFSLFSALPLELRLRIWTLCQPSPRTIYLTTRIKKGRLLFTEFQYQQRVSPLLFATWESRLCFLSSYSQLRLPGNTKYPQIVYFSPQQDTLHFDKKSFAYLLWVVSVLGDCPLAKKDTLGRIRRIETDVDGIEEIIREQAYKDVVGTLLKQFSGLREICWALQRKGTFYRRYREADGARLVLSPEKDTSADIAEIALALVRELFDQQERLTPGRCAPNHKIEICLRQFLA